MLITHLTKIVASDISPQMKNFPDLIEQKCRDNFLQLAKKFASKHELSLQTVSREAHGADSFLRRFETGEITVTLAKYDEMIDFLKRGKRREKATAG